MEFWFKHVNKKTANEKWNFGSNILIKKPLTRNGILVQTKN